MTAIVIFPAQRNARCFTHAPIQGSTALDIRSGTRGVNGGSHGISVVMTQRGIAELGHLRKLNISTADSMWPKAVNINPLSFMTRTTRRCKRNGIFPAMLRNGTFQSIVYVGRNPDDMLDSKLPLDLEVRSRIHEQRNRNRGASFLSRFVLSLLG